MRTRLLAAAATTALVLGAAPAVAPTASASSAVPRTTLATGPCGRLATPPRYTHVIWIWMENHSYSKIIGSPLAPYINSLARECGLATNYHNIRHPSLPNYIGATSGLGYSQLPTRDCSVKACATNARSIFGQGETWKAYEQSMPANCFPAGYGEYVVRHNPPPYYRGLAGCSTHDVPFSQLHLDLISKRLPAFSFVTPNLINDMHNGTVADGDRWLALTLPLIFASPQYRNGSTAVFLTWDEGEGGTAQSCATNTTDAGCHVATIVISPSTRPGTRSATLFNHYSLLGTAEQLLGLPRLGLAAAYPTMTSAFHL